MLSSSLLLNSCNLLQKTLGKRSFRTQRSICHWSQVCVDGEAGVDQRYDCGDQIADACGFLLMSLWNPHGCRRDHLSPTQGHVCGKDANRQQVECAPTYGLKDLELKAVDVTHGKLCATFVVHPEQIEFELQQRVEIDQVRWRAESEILGRSEAELEEVDCHECEQGNPRDSQIQLPRGDLVGKVDVPCPLQCHEHMEQDRQQNVLFHDICRKAQASPIQANIEISVSVEIIGTQEN